MVWLGQSVDTSSICARYSDLRTSAFLTSLGCLIRKPSLAKSHFNENLRKTMGFQGPLMIDSGGFVLSKQEHPQWTAAKLGRFIETLDADVFVSLDVPPGLRDNPEERRRKIMKSAKNYKMLDTRFSQKTIMPVIHGRTESEIQLSVDRIVAIRSNPKWIGLGGIVPLLQHRKVSGLTIKPEKFVARALALIRASFPDSNIHVFGAGGPRTFPAVISLGANSADSIGWRQAAGFGVIFLPLKSQRTMRSITNIGTLGNLSGRADLDQIEQCRCPICHQQTLDKRLALLGHHFHFRAIHNAWTSVNQTKYWPRSLPALKNLVAGGNLGRPWAEACAVI